MWKIAKGKVCSMMFKKGQLPHTGITGISMEVLNMIVWPTLLLIFNLCYNMCVCVYSKFGSLSFPCIQSKLYKYIQYQNRLHIQGKSASKTDLYVKFNIQWYCTFAQYAPLEMNQKSIQLPLWQTTIKIMSTGFKKRNNHPDTKTIFRWIQ